MIEEGPPTPVAVEPTDFQRSPIRGSDFAETSSEWPADATSRAEPSPGSGPLPPSEPPLVVRVQDVDYFLQTPDAEPGSPGGRLFGDPPTRLHTLPGEPPPIAAVPNPTATQLFLPSAVLALLAARQLRRRRQRRAI